MLIVMSDMLPVLLADSEGEIIEAMEEHYCYECWCIIKENIITMQHKRDKSLTFPVYNLWSMPVGVMRK